MTEHTTIQVTKEQAEQLADLRTYDDEPYKSVIARLLESNGLDVDAIVEALDGMELETNTDKQMAEDTAREVAKQLDYSMLASRVADELEGRMR